jgi:uncharacterized protein (TIGR00251 family)
MMGMNGNFRDALVENSHGTILSLDISAGAKKDSFPAGYNEWRHSLACHVSAPPVEGKANKAIIELVSITLSVPRSAVSIVAGAGSSQKKILVQGRSKDEIAALLEQFID